MKIFASFILIRAPRTLKGSGQPYFCLRDFVCLCRTMSTNSLRYLNTHTHIHPPQHTHTHTPHTHTHTHIHTYTHTHIHTYTHTHIHTYTHTHIHTYTHIHKQTQTRSGIQCSSVHRSPTNVSDLPSCLPAAWHSWLSWGMVSEDHKGCGSAAGWKGAL